MFCAKRNLIIGGNGTPVSAQPAVAESLATAQSHQQSRYAEGVRAGQGVQSLVTIVVESAAKPVRTFANRAFLRDEACSPDASAWGRAAEIRFR